MSTLVELESYLSNISEGLNSKSVLRKRLFGCFKGKIEVNIKNKISFGKEKKGSGASFSCFEFENYLQEIVELGLTARKLRNKRKEVNKLFAKEVRAANIVEFTKEKQILLNRVKNKGICSKINNFKEELFCYCSRGAFGNMIKCENKKCEREWFHFSCSGISVQPKGKWFCSRECKALSLRNSH